MMLSSSSWIAALISFLVACNLPVSTPDPQISVAGLFCGTTRAPPNTSYIPLFVEVMQVLAQKVTANGSVTNEAANTTANISVYTMAQCYGQLSSNDCLQCFAASRTLLPRCLPNVAGRLFLDGCFLRYDSYAFLNESVDAALDTANCSTTLGSAAAADSDSEAFRRSAGELIDNVTSLAAARGGYASEGSNGVFGLAQCWKTLNTEGCRACLAKANKVVRGCLPGREGRALITGCYFRYSTQNFLSDQSQGSTQNSGASKTGRLVAIIMSVVAFCMLSLFAGYAAYGRWKKKKQERNNLGQILSSYNKSNLNFKYETLEKATNYFDPLRKLGQGGAGCVYRGTLPDGTTVAVKRLFFSTRQWVDEFFNEVNLISGIEHKNLVKLVGCSIEGPESLLVYEFVPNKSLDHYLFDNSKIRILDWKERYNIVVGMAEGIAFLHNRLEFKIIHRDIKSSNVLLDENLDPKIADFGLARLLAADKSHLSTGIAGTLGYMAPEYLVKGQLTEKADVYSFGVLVLEIVFGRKNNAFVEDTGSLLQTIWKLYKTCRLDEAVDPCLKDNFVQSEASRVIIVGLLCAQASAALRPAMVDVVRMLTDEEYDIPEPNQPPFLNTGAISGSSTGSSYGINRSNMLIRPEVSSPPSTESFSIQSSDGHSRS